MARRIIPDTASQAKFVTPLIALAGVLFASGCALLFFQYRLQHAADAALAQRTKSAGTDSEIARKFKSAQDDYDAALEPLRHLETPVGQNSYVPTLLQQLHRLSSEDNINIVAIRPGKTQDSTSSGQSDSQSGKKGKAAPLPPYAELPISVQTEGNFSQIMRFIGDLNRFPKIVAITSIALTPKIKSESPGAGGSPLITANIGLSAYVFSSPAITLPDGSAATVQEAGGLKNLKNDFRVAENVAPPRPLKELR